jgi:GNAT superfamily N-acetyltransferase
VDYGELARRSAATFGEMLAVVGRSGGGPDAVVRRPDAVGASLAAMVDGTLVGNPWFDAAVVPAGAVPPPDDPLLPYCLWTFAGRAGGRVEDPSIATPAMGLELGEASGPTAAGIVEVLVPSTALVGTLNDRAYGSDPALGRLAAGLEDDRVRTHGLAVDGRTVCVAMTLVLGDDLGIHYVATDADHRRRGLATLLLTEVMDRARAEGMRTATLQASPDGLPVYRRMGFRVVGVLHGFVRPRSDLG